MSNLKNPKELYHKDGFPKQDQEGPALQNKMNPVPDCGENTYKGSGKLTGRNALITGGDSGIGRAVAIAFAREGANVAIHFLPGEESDAEEVKELIEKEGRKALLLPYDFKEEGNGAKIVSETVKDFGALDILVLNAAQQIAHEKLEDLPMQQVRDTFQVNIISMYESVKEAEKYLAPGSTIITTSSVNSFNPSVSFFDYAVTNGAISTFTALLSGYFAPKGIRVNGVAPGPVWTPLQLDGGQLEGGLESFGQDTQLERSGQPAELAPTYVLLASDDSSYISGEIIKITGGSTISTE